MANSSRNPNEVLNDADLKGYSRILFQQGKPVCDFELTLLGDLANPQRIADRYIGNGVPIGPDDSFAIDNLDIAAGEFTIRAGRCLVNGHEVLLSTATTYKTQPHKEQVKPFPNNKPMNVYLRVFPTEITDKEDKALQNKGDVGTVTTLREKTDWEVLATDATINLRDHFLLATFHTKPQSGVTGNLADRRRKGLTMAKLRDEFDALGGTASSLNDRLNASLNPDGTLKSNVVGNTQLANNAVTANKIVNGSVTEEKLAANAVTNLKLADNAVTTNKILNDSVTDKKLAANAVNEANLVSNAVSKRTIQDKAVPIAKLGNLLVSSIQTSIPKAVAGAPGQHIIPLLEGEEHAFFLISVRLIGPRVLGKTSFVNWIQRSICGITTAAGNPQFHQHQLVLQNFSTTDIIEVACKAYRINEA